MAGKNQWFDHGIIYIYPPTPAASRGSASEEALLATRGFGLRAAGPVRPSLPWCFGPARGSLARRCAGCESWQAKSRLGARKSKV